MKAQDLRVLKTKETIQNTLLYLLTHFELNEINVSQLCKKARISRSTFYSHYRNTSECLDDIFNSLLDELNQLYDPGKIYEREEFMEILFLFAKTHRERFAVLYYVPIKSKYVQKILDCYNTFTHKNIQFQQKEEIMWAKYRITGFLGLMEEWQRDGYSESEDTLVRAMFADR